MFKLIHGLAILTLTMTGVAVAPQATDPDDAPLTFRAASDDVVMMRFDDPYYPYLDWNLGVNLIAGPDAFEIRAKRRTYAGPTTAQQILIGPAGERRVTDLPPGIFTSFHGFEDFTSVRITDTGGAIVHEFDAPWCPNSTGSVRTRPDAPSATPYPEFCDYTGNPFLLGAVWGVQAGWSSPVVGLPQGGEEPFDLQPGDYRVTVTMNEKYRTWLRVPEPDATVQVDVTVRNYGWDAARQRPRTAPDHDVEGDAHHQIGAFHPEFRPPAKVPAALPAVPAGPKPDLRALPAWAIELNHDEDGRAYVNFAATVWNAGTSRLMVDGFRRTGEDLMDAYQYFYDAADNELGSMLVGTMEWDPRAGHLHWHFTDFAQYRLLTADKQLAVRSGKEAFCLANTDAVDYTLPTAKWRPANTDLSSSCGQNSAVAVREVLDIGNGDTYSQWLPGQSFEVTDLPNGTYWIETVANPDHKLIETRTANNSSLRKIVLGGTPGGERTLRVPPLHGIDG